MSKKPLVNGMLTASYHAFNKDRSLCAVVDNGEVVKIFESKGDDCSKWTHQADLTEVFIFHLVWLTAIVVG